LKFSKAVQSFAGCLRWFRNVWQADVNIYQAMREIFGDEKRKADDADLYYLLFGYRPVKEQK
jgi:hypothetical protein